MKSVEVSVKVDYGPMLMEAHHLHILLIYKSSLASSQGWAVVAHGFCSHYCSHILNRPDEVELACVQ